MLVKDFSCWKAIELFSKKDYLCINIIDTNQIIRKVIRTLCLLPSGDCCFMLLGQCLRSICVSPPFFLLIIKQDTEACLACLRVWFPVPRPPMESRTIMVRNCMIACISFTLSITFQFELFPLHYSKLPFSVHCIPMFYFVIVFDVGKAILIPWLVTLKLCITLWGVLHILQLRCILFLSRFTVLMLLWQDLIAHVLVIYLYWCIYIQSAGCRFLCFAMCWLPFFIKAIVVIMVQFQISNDQKLFARIRV